MRKYLLLFLSALPLFGSEELPPVDMPSAPAVTVTLPTAPAAEAAIPEAPAAEAAIPEAPAAEAAIPEAPAETISECELAKGRVLRRLRDRRIFQHTRRVTAEWLALSRRSYPVLQAHPVEPCKIIAHVQLPVSDNILAENLSFYKGKYGGVLLAFTAEDSLAELVRVSALIRDKGFKVFIACNDEAFPDPDELRKRIETLAPRSAGFFLGYMKTYAHNHLADQWYLQYFSWCAREANPIIPLIGECYCGEINGVYGQRESNTLDGVSGTLLVNAGYLHRPANTSGWEVRGKAIPLIIGPRPYYRRRGLSDRIAAAYKRQTEKKWLKAGSTVTVTLHGDGDPFNDNIAARRLILTPEKAK